MSGFRQEFKKHRAVIGYVLLVFIAVAVIELHHQKTTNEIGDLAKRACERSNILADNQRFVLATLAEISGAEYAEEPEEHPEYLHLEKAILKRLVDVPTFDCTS